MGNRFHRMKKRLADRQDKNRRKFIRRIREWEDGGRKGAPPAGYIPSAEPFRQYPSRKEEKWPDVMMPSSDDIMYKEDNC